MASNLGALRRGASVRRSRRVWRRYQRETRRPLQCLLFLLPLVVWYEVGALWVAGGSETGRDLLAPSSIREVLGWFGFLGFWVPAVVLVVALLVWHRVRRDRWRVRGWVLPLMLAESLALTIPLLVLSALFPQQKEAVTTGLSAQLLKALGAGIYEELVFRLLLISGLTWLVAETVRLQGALGLWVAVGLAAIAFSRCHFQPLGWEVFGWGPFWFRLVAGVYLSVVFVGRGVGVSSGCHAAYNMLLVSLRGGWEG